MLPAELRRLAAARARLTDRHSRIIGWGTGSVYEYFRRHAPVPLDYIVDNDSSRWGTRRDGVEVLTPDRLRGEDPRRTLVVIYSSAWPEIGRQIAGLNDLVWVPASMLFIDADVRDQLTRFESLAAAPPRPRRPSFRNTILVQGPIVEGTTVAVLRALAALYPDDGIVLSTWDDAALEPLAEATAVADDVVLSPRPSPAGVQNRNYQIASTRAGIARAQALGAHLVLKTRSDLALLSGSAFARSRWLIDSAPDAVHATGLRGRLVVPANFTRKFLLYHPSDMVMLGTADDMQRYWAAPLDPRDGSLVTPALLAQPLRSLSLTGHPTESYLGVEFCRTIGRPVLGTLADSWAFYRDFFAVVGNDWFDMLWLKNLSMPDAHVRGGVRELVSHLFWQRLLARDPELATDLQEVDPDVTTLRAIAGTPVS
jgi:hypothetical protein